MPYMKQGKQAGMAIVEAVIVVAILGIVGVTGWFVNQHDQMELANAAAGNALSTSQPMTTTTPGRSVGTLDIKEWGIHLAVDSTTASLYYFIDVRMPDVARLSLKTVSDIAPECAADKTALAEIDRLTESEQRAIVSGTTPGIAGTIHIGSYWYSYANTNAPCVPDTSQQAIARAQPSFNLQTTFKTLAGD